MSKSTEIRRVVPDAGSESNPAGSGNDRAVTLRVSELASLRDIWPVENRVERADRAECDMRADDDLSALVVYLRHIHRHKSERTFEAYAREITRFAWWCARVRGMALSDLQHEDIAEYRECLMNPPARYCGKPGRPPKGQMAPPFSSSGRSEQTVAYAMSVLSQAFQFLNDRLYLRRNLLARVSEWKTAKRVARKDRRIPVIGLDAIGRYLASMPESTQRECERKARTRLLVAIAFGLALRRSEIAALTYAQLRRDGNSWVFRQVPTKGGQHQDKHAPGFVIDALWGYRDVLGLPCPPELIERGSVVRQLGNPQALGPQTIANNLQACFREAADELALHQPDRESQEAAKQLREATAHWMRHTRASMLIEGGLSPAEAQMVLGHADARTTQEIYAHAAARRVIEGDVFQGGFDSAPMRSE